MEYAKMNAEKLALESRRAPALAALRARFAEQTTPPLPRETVCLSTSPFASNRLTGTKARGLAYERKVGKFLKTHCDKMGWELLDHQWFVYSNGIEAKYFQPDFVISRPGQDGLLVEVKLTYVDTTAQIQRYLNYLSIFGLSCVPLTIVRNLTPGAQFVDSFDKILPNSVLHLWL